MQNNLKNQLKSNYSIIPNELLLDSSLSDRARFLYCVLASKPSDWKFYNSALAKELNYSIDTLRKYINELIEAGWLSKSDQQKDSDGKFSANEYIIHPTKFTVSEKTRHGKKPTRKKPDTYKEVNKQRNNIEREGESNTTKTHALPQLPEKDFLENTNFENIEDFSEGKTEKHEKETFSKQIPELEEVEDYALNAKIDIDVARKFYFYYDSIGWRKNSGMKIQNWRSALRNWALREASYGYGRASPKAERETEHIVAPPSWQEEEDEEEFQQTKIIRVGNG